jgi:citryl-CoA lyase
MGKKRDQEVEGLREPTTMMWRTAISGQIGAETVIRGYPLTELIGRLSFAEVIFLVLKGELPDHKQRKIMEAMLVACVDHGIAPPSIVAARMVLSGGNSINTAVAAGAMTLGEWHGGAVEQLAKLLQERLTPEVSDVKEVAKQIVAEFKGEKRRVPGFGHKLYKRDPRTLKLLHIAKDIGFGGRFLQCAVAIQDELEKSSDKPLPLNLDGIFAAILCEMGISWKVGRGMFIIARMPGVVAHVVEEQERERPFRRLPEGTHSYDGPSLRHLDDGR